MGAPLIVGAGGAGSLTLTVIDGMSCRAEVIAPDLEASCRFYERYGGQPLGLTDYFAALASDWRGWDGVRAWDGIGLELRATHNGLGHVALLARLVHPPADVELWTAQVTVPIDAGQLETIARTARSFDDDYVRGAHA